MSDAPTGRRKDGKPYKEGNTREDGSYIHGKGRTPEHSRFAAGDGRRRGRRAKGTKNLLTDWEEELAETIPVMENGKKKRITKQRALVKSTVDRGIKAKERSSEIAFGFAAKVEMRNEQAGLTLSDSELIAAWEAQRAADRQTVLDDNVLAEPKEAPDGAAEDQ